MLRDLRMAMRSLRQRPVFLVVATISLAMKWVPLITT